MAPGASRTPGGSARQSGGGGHRGGDRSLLLRGPRHEQADREDEEAATDEHEGEAHHHREGRDALGEVRGVERGAQRRRGHPHVAQAVLDRLAALRIDRCQLLVRGRLAVLVEEAAHLRVGLAAGGLERVLSDHRGERLGLLAGVDLLTGDRGVGGADDLLAGQFRLDTIAAVESGDDGANTERDQNDARRDACIRVEPAHAVLLEGESVCRPHSTARPSPLHPMRLHDRVP